MRETNLSSSVVLKLAGFIANKGHHLFYDNYLSSVQLCRDLLCKRMYSCGTARSNRKEFPTSLKNPVLQRGQHKSQSVGNIQCFVWKDKKNIHFIQSICKPDELGQVLRKNKDGSRVAVDFPLPVKLYNQHMGGVDLADCKRNVYSCSRKSKKWWHRLFYFYLDVGIVNAHILESESPHCVKRTQKEFRLELAREMMAKHSSRKRKGRLSADSVPPSTQFCKRHFPDLLPGVLNC